MNSTVESCFICGSSEFSRATSHYRRCRSCGHQTLTITRGSGEIVNDALDAVGMDRVGGLDRFKNHLLRLCARSHSFMLDVGSGSGRFLYQNRGMFKRSLGIEVTPECVEFSRKLGLDIETELAPQGDVISAATLWHSLEHFPVMAIPKTLTQIREGSNAETAVIVSVPNAGSLQFSLLKERFAFYDVPHHIHQFTAVSLDRLMSHYGFEPVTRFGSFSYASFGWLQGLLNFFNTRHNYVYYRKKRGWDFGLSPAHRTALDLYNFALAGLLLLPSLGLTLFDLLFTQRAGVLTVHYRLHSKPLLK